MNAAPKPPDPRAWEREYVAAIDGYFSGPRRSWEDPATSGRVSIETIRVEGSYPRSTVDVVFHDELRDCRFGLRTALWKEDGTFADGVGSDPEPHAESCGTQWARDTEEYMTVGLPRHCTPGVVMWLEGVVDRRIDPTTYERRLKVALEEMVFRELIGFDPKTDGGVVADAVWLDGSHPNTEIVVTLKDENREGCRFGCRARVWTRDGRPAGEESWGTPEQIAAMMAYDIVAIVTAGEGELPADCEPGVITWITDTAGWFSA